MGDAAADAAADPDDVALALWLADRADAITGAAFRRADLAVLTKPDLTPVSEADQAVERAIRSELAAERPGDAVVGEEYGVSGPAQAARRWIVDPIDGTKSFVRGMPVWATLLALEEGGRVTVGVVSAPALGRRWWAARGRGAYTAALRVGPVPAELSGASLVSDSGEAAPIRVSSVSDLGEAAPIRVSAVSDLGDAQLSGASLADWGAWGGPGGLVALARRCWRDRAFGDFWSHMMVAEGQCEIGLDPEASLWDLAALQVIVEEAGGRFTDFAGVARPDGGSAISSNGLLHDEARAVLMGAPPAAPR